MTMLLLPGNARALVETLGDFAGYGWLLTPRRSMTATGLFGRPYAVDNEVFTGQFQPDRFITALGRIADAHGITACLFVVSPDVVGDAAATLARFAEWGPRIRALGFPVALAGQDGLELLPVPWDALDALFIGGTTRWKLSPAAAALVWQARTLGKWTHIGRVNSVYRACRLIEQPDSVDGTAWAKHPSKYAAQWAHWVAAGKPRMRVLL